MCGGGGGGGGSSFNPPPKPAPTIHGVKVLPTLKNPDPNKTAQQLTEGTMATPKEWSSGSFGNELGNPHSLDALPPTKP
jgi:hypothetical protein